MKSFFRIMIAFFVFGILGFAFFLFKSSTHEQIEGYFCPAHPLLLVALDLNDRDELPHGNALDLGAGSGMDTAFMLKDGWSVWAVEKMDVFMEMLTDTKEAKQFKHKLTALIKDYYKLDWTQLPQFTIVNAMYSLFLEESKEYSKLFDTISKHIIPGGRFVGAFVGELTKDQLLALFKDFNIEHFYIKQNKMVDQYSFPYFYSIMAKKRATSQP